MAFVQLELPVTAIIRMRQHVYGHRRHVLGAPNIDTLGTSFVTTDPQVGWGDFQVTLLLILRAMSALMTRVLTVRLPLAIAPRTTPPSNCCSPKHTPFAGCCWVVVSLCPNNLAMMRFW
jgi:hypothetical protein